MNNEAIQKKRAAAYCRVSSLVEEQELSFAAQKAYYEALLGNAPDLTLVRIYGDEGISGLKASARPAFQEMIADCRQGRIDEIHTRSVSRFARNYSECLTYARELRSLGVRVIFEKEGFTTFDENIELLFSLLAVLAQEESNSISQALTWAIEQRQTAGDPIRAACYGYRRDPFPTDGIHQWHIDKEEALRIRLCFRLALAGRSLRRIARELTDYEQASGSGTVWTHCRVQRLLTNAAVTGDLHCGRSYTADYLSKTKHINRGERDSVYLRGHHEPIISKEEFDAVQRLRAERREK